MAWYLWDFWPAPFLPELPDLCVRFLTYRSSSPRSSPWARDQHSSDRTWRKCDVVRRLETPPVLRWAGELKLLCGLDRIIMTQLWRWLCKLFDAGDCCQIGGIWTGSARSCPAARACGTGGRSLIECQLFRHAGAKGRYGRECDRQMPTILAATPNRPAQTCTLALLSSSDLQQRSLPEAPLLPHSLRSAFWIPCCQRGRAFDCLNRFQNWVRMCWSALSQSFSSELCLILSQVELGLGANWGPSHCRIGRCKS